MYFISSRPIRACRKIRIRLLSPFLVVLSTVSRGGTSFDQKLPMLSLSLLGNFVPPIGLEDHSGTINAVGVSASPILVEGGLVVMIRSWNNIAHSLSLL
jgi:hypothetical protein